MAITQQNIKWFNDQPYRVNNAGGAFLGSGLGMTSTPKYFDFALKNNYITPLQGFGQQQQAAPRQTVPPQGTQAFQDKLNRLTINASDALYGGLLGYNPKPIMSPTGNQYSPPDPSQGYNFRNFNFGLLSGMGGK